jgi:hypothetical protein
MVYFLKRAPRKEIKESVPEWGEHGHNTMSIGIRKDPLLLS